MIWIAFVCMLMAMTYFQTIAARTIQHLTDENARLRRLVSTQNPDLADHE